MPQDAESSIHQTRRAIVAYQAGRPEEARELLAEAIYADESNELAWLWLAALARTDQEKRYCLERAEALNPDGPARSALVHLANVRSVAPAYVADPEDLPRPREIVAETEVSGRARSWWPWLLAAAAVGLLAALVVFAVSLRFDGPQDRLSIALVGPMSGENSAVGAEMAQSAGLAVERINAAGGVDGRRIELLVYDDQNDPELARQQAEEIAAEGHVLAVLGHNSSAATLSAAEIYNRVGIPQISGTASADEATANGPWSFSTVFNNTAQGNFLATYIPQILGEKRVSIVYTDEAYGRSLYDAFTAALPAATTVAHVWRIDMGEAERDRSLQEAVESAAAAEDPGAVLIAASRLEARDLVLGLRRHGVTHRLIGTDSMGSSTFADLFQDEPEEAVQPGFFTDGIYVATPLIFDSASGEAQTLAADYEETYGAAATWRGVKIYNSALALFAALQGTAIRNTVESRQEDRERIRAQLAGWTSRELGIPGLDGPIYFDADGAAQTPVSVGFFEGRELLSAPIQLQPPANLGRFDVPAVLAAGQLYAVNGQYLQPVRVVYTGAAITELSDLDPQDGTAKFDFYIWFRYLGDDNAVDIQFVNRFDNNLKLGQPIEEAVIDGLNYRLYRVRGAFNQDLDFHDYPFDRQTVGVRLQNTSLPRDEIIYVVDWRGLVQASGSGILNDPVQFEDIDDWHVRGPVDFFQDTVSQKSSFGDPRLFRTNGKLEFSEFHINITIGRDLLSFLVRNVLPLALILTILYISLFFSHEDQTTDRVSTAVTVLLTAAVLLGAIYASLPTVGYTMAIEYGFYVFFGLTLGAVFLALIGSRLYKSGREEVLRQLDLAARIAFPIVVLATILWYLIAYIPKLTL